VFSSGSQTWSLTLREEHRLRVFKSRVLGRIFGLERDEVAGKWRKRIMRSAMICTPHPLLSSDNIEKKEMGGTCSSDGGGERRVQDFGRGP
jgi:hypothetical protein